MHNRKDILEHTTETNSLPYVYNHGFTVIAFSLNNKDRNKTNQDINTRLKNAKKTKGTMRVKMLKSLKEKNKLTLLTRYHLYCNTSKTTFVI